MIASIHQPNYLPYIGFFHKIRMSDAFVILDTTQFVKGNWHNRNRIKGNDGEIMLTIPIPSKQCYLKRIMDVPLPPDGRWAKKHLMSISLNYGKTDHYSKYSSFFDNLFSNPPDMLIDLNMSIIRFLNEQFNIRTRIIKASELDLNPELKSTEMLIEILRKIDADTYISGRGKAGKEHYLDAGLITQNSIKLEYHDFNHPVYKQKYDGFIKNLSAIDLLFNYGNKFEELIYNGSEQGACSKSSLK